MHVIGENDWLTSLQHVSEQLTVHLFMVRPTCLQQISEQEIKNEQRTVGSTIINLETLMDPLDNQKESQSKNLVCQC